MLSLKRADFRRILGSIKKYLKEDFYNDFKSEVDESLHDFEEAMSVASE